MAKKRTNENEKILDELMKMAMECFQLSDPNGTVQEVMEENPDLKELRAEVLKRMSPEPEKKS